MPTQSDSLTTPAGAGQATTTFPAWLTIVSLVAGGTLLHVGLHRNVHGAIDADQALLAFFLVLNLWINFWEFALLARGDRIREEYLASRERYAGRELDRAIEFFHQPIRPSRIASFDEWYRLWSAYALFDPSYARRSGFGFCIDVANGLTTIVPATFFLLGMTWELVPARWLGILGVAMFWQMFFGTAVYLWQFLHAGRHRGHPPRVIVGFIGGVNGMWFVVPLWGLFLSVRMILDDSYAVFR